MATYRVEIVMDSHCNGAHRLFGGQLMTWIDITAAVEARRHSKSSVTLKSVDNLVFLSPVFLDETVSVEAKLTWSGTTSMEVKVNTYVEKLSGDRNLVNSAYLIFVAIDAEGKPISVPKFVPQTLEEISEYEGALMRRQIRLSSGPM